MLTSLKTEFKTENNLKCDCYEVAYAGMRPSNAMDSQTQMLPKVSDVAFKLSSLAKHALPEPVRYEPIRAPATAPAAPFLSLFGIPL